VSHQLWEASGSLTVSWLVEQTKFDVGVEDGVWGFMIVRLHSEWKVNHSKAEQKKATLCCYMQNALPSLRMKTCPVCTRAELMWYGPAWVLNCNRVQRWVVLSSAYFGTMWSQDSSCLLKVGGCRHLHLVFSVPSPKSCKSVKIVTFVRSIFSSGLLPDLDSSLAHCMHNLVYMSLSAPVNIPCH